MSVTSPSVMKEISEPRGCVCGVLPEHGPAAAQRLAQEKHLQQTPAAKLTV
jgi:hypothetical protein